MEKMDWSLRCGKCRWCRYPSARGGMCGVTLERARRLGLVVRMAPIYSPSALVKRAERADKKKGG